MNTPHAETRKAVAYEGRRLADGTALVERVYADGTRDRLPYHLVPRGYARTGFEWGYAGAGPARLALCVLADCTDPDTALHRYQDFKWRHVASQPFDRFDLTAQAVTEYLLAAAIREAKAEREGGAA